jgi:hypothetical protein
VIGSALFQLWLEVYIREKLDILESVQAARIQLTLDLVHSAWVDAFADLCAFVKGFEWMGAMGTAPVDGIVSPAYNVYTPGPRLLPTYVDALVRIPVFAQEVTRYSKGVWSSRLRLYPEGFFETFWPVPLM